MLFAPMTVDFLTAMGALMVVVTVALQVLATRRVRRDVSFAPEQRRMQMWLIWMLPVVGAALVLAVVRDEPPERDRTHIS